MIQKGVLRSRRPLGGLLSRGVALGPAPSSFRASGVRSILSDRRKSGVFRVRIFFRSGLAFVPSPAHARCARARVFTLFLIPLILKITLLCGPIGPKPNGLLGLYDQSNRLIRSV